MSDGIDPAELVRRAAVRIAALAQDGLTYAVGDPAKDYDAARYRELTELAADLLTAVSTTPREVLRAVLDADAGYATPKVDVRAGVLDDRERFLLLRERSDGLWSLPGGWVDPGDRPAEAAVREVREETGYPVEAVKVVGVWERDVRGKQPPMPVSVFHLYFLCRVTGEPAPASELETLDVGWFGLDELPPLSTRRISRWELERVLAHHRDPSLPTEWD
ncbi:NUDIX hydrolase N-terminal domain-containing protein [Kineococcus rhizosphaerae]|uniref:ADP-ribose pyrophosphatase YjhB (NUDIX family) n=1 Tax=Kineococcus rhizosphaerae TaxID=559628 RepID=A0A2T0R9K6_9ACTN|nr:NUDIX hydrolase N-terminal domain-containing protein [Kineococcus rhizosphaerae]PRY17849.1 ADP-ribose pyrophosphatase YjhB (NUDIX family) [Kineococcus rhizosphaerae]